MVASGEGGVLPGEGSVAPGTIVASDPVGDAMTVEIGCVGIGDEVSVTSAGVADETGSGVGVREARGKPVALVGVGTGGVAEGVIGGGVGVKVGTV